MIDYFIKNLKEVNDLIDNDIEYRKELEQRHGDPSITVICDVCHHPVHAHCNQGDCENGGCGVDGADFEDEE